MRDIAAVVFDKDGTLFDFHASWGAWTSQLLDDLAGGDGAVAARLAEVLGYDLRTGRFAADSPVIAETPELLARLLLPHLPGFTAAGLVTRMNALAAEVPMVEAVPLVPLLDRLASRGLRLGVVTNDGEAPARAHLERAGVTGRLHFIAGFDSGYGAKPQPGMLTAFAEACGLEASRVAMVGDSRHDMMAGRAAGMTVIGVLTGPATHEDLAPLADAVLPDIGHLPGWLEAGARSRAFAGE